MNPAKIVSQHAIDNMQNAPTESDTSIQGMGGFKNNNYYGYTLFSSQGGTNDTQAWLQVIPSENLAVIVLSNTGNADCRSIVNDAFSAVLPNFRTSSAPISPAPVTPPITTNGSSIVNSKFNGVIHSASQDFPFSVQFSSEKKF